MNRKMIFFMLGRILQIESVLLLLPLAVSLIYGEACLTAFLLTALLAAVLGTGAVLCFRTEDKTIFAKEGFAIVALAWILMSAVGALPFVISGEISSYTDAFFETVSGFTTTGASILTDVESMSKGLLFWRSFTHWVGGMGVLVFIMALFPSEGRSIHIMRAEMPGPIVGKLVPKVRETAKLLYVIYVVLTLLEVALLSFGGMTLYESFVHAFGTVGTGGFGIKSNSIGGYSPYIQWVITIFMLLSGLNFNLYYLFLIRRFRSAFKSTELWCYVVIIAVSVALITFNILPMYETMGEAFRHSAFQTVSLMTTTGYSTTDFNLWPEFSETILILLMFIGGCAGSTAGGLKLSRVILLFKMIRRNLRQMIHPHSVGVVKFEGKKVDDHTLHSVNVYFVIYMVVFFAIFLFLSLEPFDFETTFTAATACFNNIGPGFGGVGPMASFASFSPLSKWLLSLAMLLGRLEILPILLAFTPSLWMKKG